MPYGYSSENRLRCKESPHNMLSLHLHIGKPSAMSVTQSI